MQPRDHSTSAMLRAQTERLVERFNEACLRLGLDTSGVSFADVEYAWTVSPFIAETAITHPQWFLSEIVSSRTEPKSDEYFLETLTGGLERAPDDAAAFAFIRQMRNRELARIAWRDIVFDSDVMSITQELSGFADACIQAGLAWCTKDLSARYGRPYDHANVPLSMIVIGMGKLGGCELNFSSDIDLIFAFAAGGDTRDGRRAISHQEYFDKLGKRFIALLSEPTNDGFVFRVDMRLRPFGDSGPLTSNFDALEHYYQLHGRDWERYAFVKSRAITGSENDRDRLKGIVRPFVYRRYLDYGALEAVREMKALINAEVSRRDLHDNVKLGAGGIREIEFIGQTFQLIRGGREPKLQSRSILKILGACADLNLLEHGESETLGAAYRFLRRTEHRLQQVGDRQTHQLPSDSLEQVRLAYGLGFGTFAELDAELENHRAQVRRCFADLLAPERTSESETTPDLSTANMIWTSDQLDTQSFAILGFDDAPAGIKVIEQLKRPRFLGRLSRAGRERLDRLMPDLIDAVGRRTHSSATLARVAVLIQAIARRSVYLALLADHPDTLKRLIDLYHASPWIARQITQQPLLLDELLDTRALYAPPDRDQLVKQLGTLCGQHSSGDLEEIMDTLRNFKNQQVLRVAASDLMEQFPVAEVSNQLSYIAAALLHQALFIASEIMGEKHGKPQCVVQGEKRDVGFAIIAYGKLGGFELGYSSDLDLVFLHDGAGNEQVTGGPRAVDNTVYFTRLIQRIIHFLSTRTAAGRAYEVDTRLRPGGESGLLVSSIDAFLQYQRNNAWTWEHQALIRARAVAGDPRTMQAFGELRRTILGQARDAQQLRHDIVEMRTRMRTELDRSDDIYFDLKHGVGAITDIEFMVQYGVLRWANEYPDLLEFTDILRLLEVLTRLELMPAELGKALHDAYFAYRADVHRAALQELDGMVETKKFRQHRATVQKAWSAIFEHD